jgi:hypothetical protein
MSQVGLNGGGQWTKLSTRMMLQHKTRPEMHREVRAILTSVSELSFKASRGKTWWENENKTAMGIRPSSSLKKINSGSMMLSSPGFRH